MFYHNSHLLLEKTIVFTLLAYYKFAYGRQIVFIRISRVIKQNIKSNVFYGI